MAVLVESTSHSFSSLGGLYFFEQVFDRLGLRRKLRDVLPRGPRARKSFEKFKAMLLGFVAGADCLDDMRHYGEDEAFEAICKSVHAPITYGRFLRDFERPDCRGLSTLLIETSLRLRQAAFPDERDFVLDIDSTDHIQYGKKMEGLAWNYKDHWGLDSLQAFDSLGFQYWMDVRPGNTFTSQGAIGALSQIFRKVPKKMKRFLRADSGFCNQGVFNTCYEARAKFVIAMRANMFEPLLKSSMSTHWKRNTSVRFRDGRVCEVTTLLYHPIACHETLRVLVARAPKVQKEVFGDNYDYLAWVTNLGSHEIQDEEIVDFYQGRGNSENFIRELKNGFDFHHFPCQKLLANQVYGLIGAFAHTLMRYAAYVLSPESKTVHFAKKLRFRMVHLAVQVVRKARRVILRFSKPQHEEVSHWITIIKYQLDMS